MQLPKSLVTQLTIYVFPFVFSRKWFLRLIRVLYFFFKDTSKRTRKILMLKFMLFLEVGHSKGNIKKKLKQIFIFFMVLLMRNYNLIFVLIFFSTSLGMIFILNGFFSVVIRLDQISSIKIWKHVLRFYFRIRTTFHFIAYRWDDIRWHDMNDIFGENNKLCEVFFFGNRVVIICYYYFLLGSDRGGCFRQIMLAD